MRRQTITCPTSTSFVFHGRNGTGLCAGLQVMEDGTRITFTPITSRHKLANCAIDVPVAMLPELIETLRRMLPRAVRKLR